jgi:hypothetical protein
VTAPEPPTGLDDIERHVTASDAPAVCFIDRENFRALLAYLRRLENIVARVK